ncbi:MAG: hypothetical protein JOZ81_29705 [Chloroflexi bacterium]|nr:hypothetical protein [Chloroflexota bacterium]MBV9547668.1 hypothetical protein [Chloroflexota bacterium]
MTRGGQRETRRRRAIVAVLQATDGLVYDVLECGHRQLIVAPPLGVAPHVLFRYCGLCARRPAAPSAPVAPAIA